MLENMTNLNTALPLAALMAQRGPEAGRPEGYMKVESHQCEDRGELQPGVVEGPSEVSVAPRNGPPERTGQL